MMRFMQAIIAVKYDLLNYEVIIDALQRVEMHEVVAPDFDRTLACTPCRLYFNSARWAIRRLRGRQGHTAA